MFDQTDCCFILAADAWKEESLLMKGAEKMRACRAWPPLFTVQVYLSPLHTVNAAIMIFSSPQPSSRLAFPHFIPHFLHPPPPPLLHLPSRCNWGNCLAKVAWCRPFHLYPRATKPAWRGGRDWRRSELINQPNENIPTETKTSYSHIRGAGGGIDSG